MGKKLLSLIGVLCIALSGCSKHTSVETDVSPTVAQTIPTIQTEATLATQEPTLETQVPTEVTVPETQPIVYVGTPGTEWTPICQEYINLWEAPHSNNVICQIPVGSTVYLEKWQEKYAQVIYDGKLGYVHANYIKPEKADYFSEHLSTVAPTHVYSYNQMLQDMNTLQKAYPDLVQISSIGTSEDGRDIPVMVIGATDATRHVLIQGAMHGREHFTAWLAMALADHALLIGQLDSVCYHIIPMSNPDGVCISQSGQLNEAQNAIHQQDFAAGYTTSGPALYAQQWKANALGVDLNRNFPCGWESCTERTAPSSEKYRGQQPFSAAETVALRDYTLSRTFDATISLHSHGSVIYYKYGSKQPVNNLSRSLAVAVQKATGYVPTGYDNTTGAGYKDWAMEELGIPSLTVEIGNTATPLAQRDIYNTFARCKGMLPAIDNWLSKNK